MRNQKNECDDFISLEYIPKIIKIWRIWRDYTVFESFEAMNEDFHGRFRTIHSVCSREKKTMHAYLLIPFSKLQ